jgi:hypothetical protein
MHDILGDENIFVVDDVLDETTIKDIETHILNSNNVTWSYYLSDGHATVGNEYFNKYSHIDTLIEGPQLCHHVYCDNEILSPKQILLIEEVIKNIQNKFNTSLEVTRCKFNLQFQLPNNSIGKHNTPHIDTKEDHFGMIYYVNDCDGDTYFFDDNLNVIKTVSPKSGRMVFFKGNILHTGQHPINSPARCVINFNFQ